MSIPIDYVFCITMRLYRKMIVSSGINYNEYINICSRFKKSYIYTLHTRELYLCKSVFIFLYQYSIICIEQIKNNNNNLYK